MARAEKDNSTQKQSPLVKQDVCSGGVTDSRCPTTTQQQGKGFLKLELKFLFPLPVSPAGEHHRIAEVWEDGPPPQQQGFSVASSERTIQPIHKKKHF